MRRGRGVEQVGDLARDEARPGRRGRGSRAARAPRRRRPRRSRPRGSRASRAASCAVIPAQTSTRSCSPRPRVGLRHLLGRDAHHAALERRRAAGPTRRWCRPRRSRRRRCRPGSPSARAGAGRLREARRSGRARSRPAPRARAAAGCPRRCARGGTCSLSGSRRWRPESWGGAERAAAAAAVDRGARARSERGVASCRVRWIHCRCARRERLGTARRCGRDADLDAADALLAGRELALHALLRLVVALHRAVVPASSARAGAATRVRRARERGQGQQLRHESLPPVGAGGGPGGDARR